MTSIRQTIKAWCDGCGYVQKFHRDYGYEYSDLLPRPPVSENNPWQCAECNWLLEWNSNTNEKEAN